MNASTLPLVDLVDQIRDCMGVAGTAAETGDRELYDDAIAELRPLYVEYRRRTGTSAYTDAAQ